MVDDHELSHGACRHLDWQSAPEKLVPSEGTDGVDTGNAAQNGAQDVEGTTEGHYGVTSAVAFHDIPADCRIHQNDAADGKAAVAADGLPQFRASTDDRLQDEHRSEMDVEVEGHCKILRL